MIQHKLNKNKFVNQFHEFKTLVKEAAIMKKNINKSKTQNIDKTYEINNIWQNDLTGTMNI